MKRLAVVVLGAFVASLLVLVPGINVGAQEDADFVINPDTGVPGDLIAASVDPDAVHEECVSTVEEVQELFGGPGGIIEQWTTEVAAMDPPLEFGSYEWWANILFTNVMGAIATDEDAAASYLAGTFLLSFIDIATQDPLGEFSNFAMPSGEGTIVVPELDPGLYVVAAICVSPVITAESVAAALAAGAAYLEANETFEQPTFDFTLPLLPQIAAALGVLSDDEIAEFAAVVFAELMQPDETWTAPFTVLGEAVVPSPENEVFCAVLPALQPLGAEITEALADLPEDDGEMSQEEWEDLADWDEIGAELEELFAAASELLADGDESRPDEVAPQWETVTEGLRAARNALEAVDYDLSTESGRTIAGQLREGARDDSPNPEGDAATAVLTQWFIDNCIPAPAETPVEETPRAAPAAPAQARPTFAG